MDGYAGYNRLLKRSADDVALAYWWAHTWRKPNKVARSGTASNAEEALKQIAAFYRIEKQIRNLTAKARLAARQDQSVSLIAASEVCLAANLARISLKAPLGEAFKYIAKYWDGLCLFPTDGRIKIDNNAVDPRAYLVDILEPS